MRTPPPQDSLVTRQRKNPRESEEKQEVAARDVNEPYTASSRGTRITSNVILATRGDPLPNLG